ncbi:MAG: acylphosphatase [Leptospira sp.]|nr:acylphosphatase [Leptospira sp.]
MEKTEARVRIVVEGKVQGVGFRYFVLQKAQELRLRGFTMNLPTGEVETVAEGDKIFLEDLEKSIRQGPRGSTITNVTVQWQKPWGGYRTFEIKK